MILKSPANGTAQTVSKIQVCSFFLKQICTLRSFDSEYAHFPQEVFSDKLITHSTVSKRELDTRNSQMLNIPLFRTATGQKTFYYRTVNIWNNLNNDIKLCIDVNSFRNKLRGVLLDKFKREEWYPNDLQL